MIKLFYVGLAITIISWLGILIKLFLWLNQTPFLRLRYLILFFVFGMLLLSIAMMEVWIEEAAVISDEDFKTLKKLSKKQLTRFK